MGAPKGIDPVRRNQLYRAAQRALGAVPYHEPPLPTVRNWPHGWTSQGRMWHRLETLEVLGALYRLELDKARDMLDDAAREYVDSVKRVRDAALADPLTGAAETRPLRMRPSRSAS